MVGMLLVILLLEGFITISVEILTIRQLTPFYGNSIIITSMIIGVFLLFLALGYWRGGTRSKAFFQRLNINFILSMFWIGIGLNYAFIAFFFYLTTFKLRLPLIPSLILYLVFIVAPIVYWLGQTIPLTTNLFNQQLKVSRISGYALFLSTIGSFLGALITSLVLFQYFGVAWTIVIDCCLLFILLLQLRPHHNKAWLPIIGLGLALYFIKAINIDTEKTLFLVANNYANYRVTETVDKTRHLEINLSNSSTLTATEQGLTYIQFIRNVLFNQLNIQHKKILVIGAGGFTLTANGTHKNQVTYVDIDPEIKTISEKYFLQHKIKGQFIGQDARHYLHQTLKRYDVIVSDVYAQQTSIPSALLTINYFQELANHLTTSGLLFINVISNPLFNDDFSKRTANTIHTVFRFCAVIPLQWQQPLSNIIYICPNQSSDHHTYSDNLTTATFDFMKSQQNAQQSNERHIMQLK